MDEGFDMRVLITTDSVGGVWQYSLSLVRGLVELHGCRVMLICFGEPSHNDLAQTVPGGGVELVPLNLKLEWMPDSGRDLQEAIETVGHLADSWDADLIHSNQFCFGALATSIPKVVVAHSDVLSWSAWQRRDGEETARLPETDWGDYVELVRAGLKGASAVVAPSGFMAASLERFYGCSAQVIHNGLWPDLYPSEVKDGYALTAGRLWDPGKGAHVAVEAVKGLPVELRLAGPMVGPASGRAVVSSAPNAVYLGSLPWGKARQVVARARYYLATSSYEPFGLAPLEAALCGCALVANDIPSYRELWQGTALFYRRNDPLDLRAKLSDLIAYPEEADRLGRLARKRALRRFTGERMAGEYRRLHGNLVVIHRPVGAGLGPALSTTRQTNAD